MRVARARHRDGSDMDSPPTRSGTTSGTSSLGLDTSGVAGPMPWSRAVQLCRDTDMSIGSLVLQASTSDDVSEVSSVCGATPREREFLGYYADFASSAASSRCTSAVTSEADGRPPVAIAAASQLASQLGHVVLALAERYDDVLASPSLHASFVAALASCTPVSETASDEMSASGSSDSQPTTTAAAPTATHGVTATVDMAAVAALVAKGVSRTFPGADPAKPGSRTWYESHTQLLTCIYNTARELVIPATCGSGAPSTPAATNTATTPSARSSSSGATSPEAETTSHHHHHATSGVALYTPGNLPRLTGGAAAVTASVPILERTTDLLNQSLAIEELPNLQRNPAFLTCLARILTMSSVVDPSALPEGLTASLNECFAKCTRGIDALLARPGDGLPVVQAILDDLARGLNARRYVTPRIVDLSRDAIGRHAVAAFLDHTAKVSKSVGTDVLQPASPQLLEEAGVDAPSLLLLENAANKNNGIPTLVAMACHPQASVVVPVILRYADGYHAVAFSEALHAHADALRESNRAAAALAWCAANPAFKDAVIVSHNRLGRDLVIERTDISPSAGIKAIDAAIASTPSGVIIAPHRVTGRVCFTFAETGACASGAKCALLHVDGAVVTALCNRDCCLQHGSPAFVTASAAPMATVTSTDKGLHHAGLRIICTADHSRSISIAPSQLSFTAGLAVYLARDHNIGLPIESDALCRQHSRCCCQKPQQCKYIHVCREVYAAVAEWTAPPPKADVTSPTAAATPTVPTAKVPAAEDNVTASTRNAHATRPPKKNASAAATAAAAAPDATPPPGGNPRRRPVSGGGLPPRSAASSMSDLAAATANGRKPMEIPPGHRRARHTPYSTSTPTGAPSTSAFANRSPSVSTASTSNRFVTHVDASPPSLGSVPATAPAAGVVVPAGNDDESPQRDARVRPLTNFVTPDLRGHARQVSDYSNGHFSVGSMGGSYNNVSESPLAVAMGSASRKDSRRPSGNARSLGGGGGRSVTSASGSVSHGANTTSDLGGVHPSFGGYGFALGPGHSTPRGGRHSSQTPTTNRTV